MGPDGLPKRKYIIFDWRAYTHTYAKIFTFLLTLGFFGGAYICFSIWASPEFRLAYQMGAVPSSREVLLGGLLATCLLFFTGYYGERVGLIPYSRFKAYLCIYRLSFFVMLAALVLAFLGYGQLSAMGNKAKDRCYSRACPRACCTEFSDLHTDGAGFGDWFRTIDGYVALEQSRTVAYTQELHRLREGDELYQPEQEALVFESTARIVNVSAGITAFGQPDDAKIEHDPNAPTRYHQIPPPWITIDVIPLKDVLQTVTAAPIFARGEVCLERPPPTNQVCLKRNTVIGLAVKFSAGFCREIGSTTCQVDWDMMQIKPSYRCDPKLEYVSPGSEDRYASGTCGRVLDPQGSQAVLLREVLKRLYADGWSFGSPVSQNPVTLDTTKIKVVDVEEDPCISGAEGCIARFNSLGTASMACAILAAVMVVFTMGADVFHDYLMRQIQLIDLKEMELQRKVRRAVEADKLRTLETMHMEQSLQMADLEAMAKEADDTVEKKKQEAQNSMFQPLQPGAVAPV